VSQLNVSNHGESIKMIGDHTYIAGYWTEDSLRNYWIGNGDKDSLQLSVVNTRNENIVIQTGSNTMTMTTSSTTFTGNIGIKTNNPQYTLDVTGTINATSALYVNGDIIKNGTNKWIIHTPNDGRTDLIIAPWNYTDDEWNWEKSTSIDANGNMTVNGFIRPSAGQGENGIIFPKDPYTGAGDVAFIKYYQRGTGEACTLEIGIQNDRDDHILLNPSGDEGGGNVGIKNSNPQYTLDVSGVIRATGNILSGTPGTVGYILLNEGYNDLGWYNTGFLSFFTKDGIRQGYIGPIGTTNPSEPNTSNSGPMFFAGDNGCTGFTFTTFDNPKASANMRVEGTITATGAITASSLSLTSGAYIDTSGNLYIGSIDFTGNITATNTQSGAGNIRAVSFNASSDYRVKKDIKPLKLEEYSVDNLNPVHFKFKDSEKESIGLIAHELQKEYPFLVEGEKDGEKTQSVNYNGLIGVLIKEIQELKNRIKILENKIEII
jgi:hypothetical protein